MVSSNLTQQSLYPLQKRAPSTNWIGGRVVWTCGEKRYHRSCQELNPDSLLVCPVSYSLYQLGYPGPLQSIYHHLNKSMTMKTIMLHIISYKLEVMNSAMFTVEKCNQGFPRPFNHKPQSYWLHGLCKFRAVVTSLIWQKLVIYRLDCASVD